MAPYFHVCIFVYHIAGLVAFFLTHIHNAGHDERFCKMCIRDRPSAHSALVCSMFMAAAKSQGVNSPIFAIAFILAAIVMYDAMGVRRETGEQAKVLNRMISDWLSEDEDAPAYLAQNGRKLKEKVCLLYTSRCV